MSKIIEPGTPPKIKEGRCTCGCLFEFTDLDLIVYSALYAEKIKCPNCGKATTANEFEYRRLNEKP